MPTPTRIAMWSGPRNISTAMMRSWGSRADTAVTDEPLYGHYLVARPEVDHPGRDEVIASMETDWQKVTAALLGPVPGNKPIWYQKHMTHHLLPGVDTAWVRGLTNCFLIRDPREVLISLAKVTPNPAIEDTGIPQQLALFRAERERLGRTPPVIDAKDVLIHPRRALSALCAAAGIPFDDAMLRWEPGPRATDGIWGKHWYAAVENSTGFGPWRERREQLPPHLGPVEARCRAMYEELHEHRIRG
jgi:hypothetical protein